MQARRIPFFLVLCGLVAPAAAQPALTADNWRRWHEHVLPRPSELRWESIPWHPTLADGLAQASAEARPLLLWTMNGHPLGCT